MKKIYIIGHIASGKTTLARHLGTALNIPVLHIDSYEFNSDLSKRNMAAVREDLRAALQSESWILDGYGPLDLLPEHFSNADIIIFLNNSFAKNLFHLVFRQVKIFFIPRTEMPLGSREWKSNHVKKLYQTLKKQHRLMQPELLRILQKPNLKNKVLHVRNPRDLASIRAVNTVNDLASKLALTNRLVC